MVTEDEIHCEWTRGATPGVYKSSCSLVPFLHQFEPEDDKECPYCGCHMKVFGQRVAYDDNGEVQNV